MLYRDYLKDKYQSTALKTAYAEGVPCVLEYSKGKNIRNYEVYGNSVQDGVPTPESPVEIQSVGDLVTDTESEHYGKYDIPITVKSKSTAYEPYKGGETIHIYLDEPLRKVGEYADYIDFKGQKVVRNTAQTTFNGSERWVKTGDVSSGVYQGFAVSNTIIGAPSGDFECLSDKFPYSSTTKKNIVQLRNSAYSLRIIIGSEYVPDLETATFKNWLSENNVKLTYPIATPTEENISLPVLKTFKGTSIISVDTSVQPSNIKAKYVRL